MDDHLCNLRSIPPKEEFIPKFIYLILNVVRMREPSVRKGMCQPREKIVKTVNLNRYVTLAQNVRIVKHHGAVNPRIDPTLWWPIPSVQNV